MMDFRGVDIAKQKAYDLLRDWIKLVARHTNPDQDISELLGWLWKLKPATPDPTTGLVPCGCGGKAQLGELQYTIVDPDLMPEYYAYCQDCGITTENSADRERVEAAWNRAMGWRG